MSEHVWDVDILDFATIEEWRKDHLRSYDRRLPYSPVSVLEVRVGPASSDYEGAFRRLSTLAHAVGQATEGLSTLLAFDDRLHTPNRVRTYKGLLPWAKTNPLYVELNISVSESQSYRIAELPLDDATWEMGFATLPGPLVSYVVVVPPTPGAMQQLLAKAVDLATVNGDVVDVYDESIVELLGSGYHQVWSFRADQEYEYLALVVFVERGGRDVVRAHLQNIKSIAEQERL